MKSVYLFTGKDCPNCPVVKQVVEEAMQGMSCDVKIVDVENIGERLQFELLENQLFIFSVPTIILKEEGGLRLISSGTVPTVKKLIKDIGG